MAKLKAIIEDPYVNYLCGLGYLCYVMREDVDTPKRPCCRMITWEKDTPDNRVSLKGRFGDIVFINDLLKEAYKPCLP